MQYGEYASIINKTKPKPLIPGCYYYIEETDREELEYRIVYSGKYTESTDKFDNFENVSIVVNPFNMVGRPHGFMKEFFKYTPNYSKPCDTDVKNKEKAISELAMALEEMKDRPISSDETNVAFMGENYRTARDSWNRTHKRNRTNARKKNVGNKYYIRSNSSMAKSLLGNKVPLRKKSTTKRNKSRQSKPKTA